MSHRSPLTKAQRHVIRQIGRDGHAFSEINDGRLIWRTLAGHRYNKRTIDVLIRKGKLQSGNDSWFGTLPQTLVLR